LTGELSLTEQQQAELKKINAGFAEKMKAQGEAADFEKRKALRQEHQAAIEKVLTSEQKEKLDFVKQ
jgi:hypothetical protein